MFEVCIAEGAYSCRNEAGCLFPSCNAVSLLVVQRFLRFCSRVRFGSDSASIVVYCGEARNYQVAQ